MLCGWLLSPAVAGAQEEDEPPVEALVGIGLGYRWLSAIDLAEQAGASGYGSEDDTTGRGILSLFDLRGGVLFASVLELDVSAWIGIGGLALADVEQRYFGSTDVVGGALALGADASARYAPKIASDWRLLIGPGASLTRLSASSSLGLTRVDLVGVGLDLGARLHTNRMGSVADGHVELVLRARRELPAGVHVSAGDDVLFSGTSGSGDPIWSLGATVSYVTSFHRAR